MLGCGCSVVDARLWMLGGGVILARSPSTSATRAASPNLVRDWSCSITNSSGTLPDTPQDLGSSARACSGPGATSTRSTHASSPNLVRDWSCFITNSSGTFPDTPQDLGSSL